MSNEFAVWRYINGQHYLRACKHCDNFMNDKNNCYGYSDDEHEMYLCLALDRVKEITRLNHLIPVLRIKKITGKASKDIIRKGWLRYRRFDKMFD